MTNFMERPGKRRCNTCRELKPLDHFFRKGSGHQHHCKVCSKIARQAYEKTPTSKAIKREKLLARYGLTEASFRKILVMVNGVCEICKRPQEGQQLAVDHCHEKGHVRGLLCKKCNVGLGNFGDDVDNLRRAIQYLMIDAQNPDRWRSILEEEE